MARFEIIRGNPSVGATISVWFEEMGMWALDLTTAEMAHTCLSCGALVFGRPNCERHADFHFGLAAGRPWGATPPGFGT